MPALNKFSKFFLNPYRANIDTHLEILEGHPNVFNFYLRENVILRREVDEDKFSQALDVIFKDFGAHLILYFNRSNFDLRDLLLISNNKLLFIALDKILFKVMQAKQGLAIIYEGELFFKIFAKAALNYRNDPSQASPAEFVKIIDKHFKEKEIPAEFYFENEKSTGKSFACAARLSPVGALDGNPWPASCSPGLELWKRTILLQGSFFKEVGEEDKPLLKKKFARLINEGFEIVYFEGDEVRKIKDADELSRLNLDDLPDVDAKKSAQILAKKSIAISEVVILNGDNRDILEGVFFNYLDNLNSLKDQKLQALFLKKIFFNYLGDNSPKDQKLKALLKGLFFGNYGLKPYRRDDHSIEKPNKDNIFYLVRNNIKLTAQQMGELQEIASLKGDYSNYEQVLHIFFNAVLADNAEVLQVLCNELNKIFQVGATVEQASLAVLFAKDFTDILMGPHEDIVRTLSDNFTSVLLDGRNISEVCENYNFELAKFLLKNYSQERKMQDDVKSLWNNAINVGDVGLFTLLRDNAVPRDELGPYHLIAAASLGHRKIVEMMLEMGVDVNGIHYYNHDSALIAAIRKGDKDIVELLIARNADLTVKNMQGDSILMIAVASGYRDIAELLIKKLGGINEEKKPLLLAAAANGHMDVVKMLFEHDADINKTGKNSALVIAAEYGHVDVVEALLDCGVDVDERDYSVNSVYATGAISEYGHTALFDAVDKGHLDVARILLDRGAQVNSKSFDGLTPLMAAAYNSNVEMATLLIERGADIDEVSTIGGNNAYIYAVKNLKPEMVELLLSKSTECINQQNNFQQSPLILAIQLAADGKDKAIDIVKLLLSADNISILGDKKTLIMYAKNNTQIVELLLERGADIWEPSLWDSAESASIWPEKIGSTTTALVSAARHGYLDVVRLLLDKSKDLDPKTRQIEMNKALLAVASRYGSYKEAFDDIAKLLIEAGADVNTVDNDGFTPLMLAAQAGCKEIVRLLIAGGADVNKQNSNGDTALILVATDMRDRDIHEARDLPRSHGMVDLLLENGANKVIENRVGNKVSFKIFRGGNMGEVFDRHGKPYANFVEGSKQHSTPAPNGFYCAANGGNKVVYSDDKNAVFKMSQVGEPLNLDKISKDMQIRVREGVFHYIKNGKFERNKKAEIVNDLSEEITRLRKAFNQNEISKMRQAADFGYALLTAETSKNQDTLLFGLNYSYEIVAIRTDPENAVIKSLTIDEDGFYHVKTDRKCSVSYILKFDHQLEKITGNEAVDFAREFQKSFNATVELPQKKDFASHEAFLEAVYERKSIKTSCGLRVEVALHMMKKSGIDDSNIKMCGIDGNHAALEATDAKGKIHYLDLGGGAGEKSYDEIKYDSKAKNAPQSAEDVDVAIAPRKTIGSRILSALSRIPAAIARPFRLRGRVGLAPDLPVTAPKEFDKGTVVNPLFNTDFSEVDSAENEEDRKLDSFANDLEALAEESSDSLSRNFVKSQELEGESQSPPTPEFATNKTSISSTAEAMQEFSRKKPRQLLSNAEFVSALKGNKSPTLYISPNTELLTNNIAQSLQQNSKQYSSHLPENGVPVFILNNPALLDLDKSKFKIAKTGEVVFDEKGFLSDFLAQVKSYNNELRKLEDGIVPADFKSADLAPTLIIDWSKFNSRQRVALNSLLDENPAINKHDFSGIKIISLDKTLSKDSSFLGRHQDFYEASSTILSPAAKPANSSLERQERQFDLQGFDNWMATLFGNIILENGQTKWQKSKFVEELEGALSAQKSDAKKTSLIFNITNSSNNPALEEFLQMSAALGYFTYQGYQIALPQNTVFTVNKAPFNFKQFNRGQHQLATNITINQIPDDCQIMNGQIFDLLLCQTKIHDEKYVEELGLIAHAATREGKTLKLFITSQLTDAQFYVLFSEAKKHEVKLELCLAPQVKLPRDLELQAQVLPPRSKVLDDNKLKSAIVLTQDSSQIIAEILAQEKSHQTTLPENMDIFVLNVEDFSYEDLVKKTSYIINPNGSFSSFKEHQSAFIDALKAGKRIILKGEFSSELLQALQPILLENYAQNLMLIIENRAAKPVNLNWLEPDLKLDIETTVRPKEIAEEKFDADISAQDFISQRTNLFAQHFNANQMLHLVGISGVGKSTLIEEFSRENKIPLYSGLDSLTEFAKNKTPGSPKILFIDESNIEDFHLTIFEELKRGEKRILYKGEIIELDDSHKIIFASNPVKFGGGRNEQKLFSDKRIQQIDLSPMPASYIMHLLERDIFAKCTIAEKGEIEDFRNACQEKIAQYNEKLGKDNALTIREVQQCALEYLSAKASDNFKYEKLQTPNFISTAASEKIEKEILQAINIYRLQRQGKLPVLGTPGILLEGLPGIGKSAMLEAYLQTYLPDSFVKISGSSSLEEQQQLLEEAYEKGKIAMIDELDATIAMGLEKPLNLFLSNSHPSEAKQKMLKDGTLTIIPGQALFATANGIGHEGRKLISPALRHRMKCPELDATKTKFEKDEVVEIIKSWSKNFKAGEGKTKPARAIAKKIDIIADAFLQIKEGSSEDQEYNFRELKSYCRKEFQGLGMVEARGIKNASHLKVLDMGPATVAVC